MLYLISNDAELRFLQQAKYFSVLKTFYIELSTTFLLYLVPSEPPPNSVIKSTSESSIRVSWEQISQVHVHGILLGYEVRYAIDDGSSPWMSKTLGVDEYEIHLKDLEYFTPYKVVVCARTSKGCGEEYSDIAYTFGDGEFMHSSIHS